MKRSTICALAVLSGAAVFAGCATAPVAPPVTAAMARPGADVATLNHGREIFTTRCTSCHRADPPSSHSVAQWDRIVAEMAARSKLQAAERAALLAYLHAAHG